MGRVARPLEERFWEYVDKSGPIHPEHGQCWVWTGPTVGGYGHLRVRGGAILAHRYSYELHHGPVPDGLCILHKCDRPSCQRPEHLWPGTRAENNADRDRKGRAAKCPQPRPEQRARGDRNGARLHPERMPRGDAHHARARPETVARGERSGRAKLTESQIPEVREMRARGATYKEIAACFNVTPQLVFMIVKRQIWAHVA